MGSIAEVAPRGRLATSPSSRDGMSMLVHLLLPSALGGRWFPLDAAAPATSGIASARAMPLYPLPALYLPGSTCMVRNVQLRNIAMCKANAEFAAALVSLDDAQRAQCSRVCSVLRVEP